MLFNLENAERRLRELRNEHLHEEMETKLTFNFDFLYQLSKFVCQQNQ